MELTGKTVGCLPVPQTLRRFHQISVSASCMVYYLTVAHLHDQESEFESLSEVDHMASHANVCR